MPLTNPAKTSLRRFARFGGLALAVVVIDQATKVWATRALSSSSLELIPRALVLELRTNEGAAFSLFSNHPEALTVVAAAVAIAVLIWLYKTPASDWPTAVGLSLVLGGAIGNLIDRARFGCVTDFIRVDFTRVGIDWSWPTFNVADSAICVGMGVLVFFTLFPQKNAGLEEHPETEPDGQ
jgi:signal peptidase II